MFFTFSYGKNIQVFLLLVFIQKFVKGVNPLNSELNTICHLLALLGAHHILHVSGLRVNSVKLEALQSIIRP